MKIGLRTLAAVGVLILAPTMAAPVLADGAEETPVVTRQSIRIDGKPLAYTAETGRIAIRHVETGEPRGYMFYIAYRVASPAKPRPVTFVWNGGPGANSALLHLEIAGPKRAEQGRLVDNAQTWLKSTDLVFVDPIGTGFSRPAKTEYASEFYGTVGDVASVTEFVRAWRLLHGAEDSAVYLAGESWGAGRAASVGYALQRRGVKVDGLALISGGSGMQNGLGSDLAAALAVPDLAAAAFSHGKIAPALGADLPTVRAAAEAWARETYLPSLGRVASLTDAERTAVTARLSAFTGLAPDQIPATLQITPRLFRTALLRSTGQTLNTFDMRRASGPSAGGGGGGAPEPSLIARYLRRDLGYRTSLAYIGDEPAQSGYAPGGRYPQSVGARWDYATGPATPAEVQAAMQLAMERGDGPPRIGPPLPATVELVALNPSIRILVAAGLYDSLNSCTGNAETERRLAPPLKASVYFKCYEGGHMMYRDEPSRIALSRDIDALVTGRR